MLTAGYFPRLPAIIYIPVTRFLVTFSRNHYLLKLKVMLQMPVRVIIAIFHAKVGL